MAGKMNLIENSDRGITLNKSLAWTILGSLIAVGMYVGSTVATLTNRVDNLSNQFVAAEQNQADTKNRVSTLETLLATNVARLDAMFGFLQEIRSDQKEMNGILRDMRASQTFHKQSYQIKAEPDENQPEPIGNLNEH